MAIQGYVKCCKAFVFTVNFCLWVVGMCTLGFGVFLRVSTDLNHYLLASYGEKIQVFHIICYIIIGAGFLMTFIGFLGCCGAFQESKVMVGLFFAFLLLVFAAQIVGGAWAFINRQQLRDSVADTFKEIIQKEYGTKGFDLYPVDFVQKEMRCCGSSGPSDWFSSHWQSDRHGFSRVPDSCCAGNGVSTDSGGLCGVGGAWFDGFHPAVYTDGCATELKNAIYSKTMLLMSIGIGIGALEIVSLILALLLCCGLQQQASGGYKA